LVQSKNRLLRLYDLVSTFLHWISQLIGIS
jgi:hypothetical protein